MKLAWSLLLAPGLVLNAWAVSQVEPAEDRVFVPRACAAWASIGGRNYSASPTVDELKAAPRWTPFEGSEPPVSAGQAIAAATSEVAAHFKDSDVWVMDSVSLARICSEEWAWAVFWRPKGQGTSGSLRVIVPMSGKAIPLERLKPLSDAE